jgi:hypothetical protein
MIYASEDSLFLAAEECPPETFERHHLFDAFDEKLLRSLTSHGPVLIRGARGAGKSALMLEAHRRVLKDGQKLGAYISMRYLPLIEANGHEYIEHLLRLTAEKVQNEIQKYDVTLNLVSNSVESFKASLTAACRKLNKGLVIYFDDAAHIGRETSLEDFFDFFRLVSSDLISCKASIYPGITHFGRRFDVFNDAYVIDVSRDERVTDYSDFFFNVALRRRPDLAKALGKFNGTEPEMMANILGRTVLGNMRGFIVALLKLDEYLPKYNDANDIPLLLLELGNSHFWPLLDEVKPKLGRYEPMLEVAEQLAEIIFSESGTGKKNSAVILKDLCQKYAKPLEILEYVGFIAKREASRKVNDGRGPRYILNWAVLTENLPGKRLPRDLVLEFSSATPDVSVFSSGSKIARVALPELPQDGALSVLSLQIGRLIKSNIYPYGLTQTKADQLNQAGFSTIRDLLNAKDQQIDDVPSIGQAWVKRIRDVVSQAVWM